MYAKYKINYWGEHMKKDSFLKGTLMAYISIIIVKVLGVLYVIPFYSIIGETGGVLYNYAYQIYNLFLSISTSGIPIAISIIISEYNSLNMNKSKNKTFKIANKLIFTISFIAFLVLFIFAGPIGQFMVSGIEGTTSIESLKLVIRSVSVCLLIIPFLSVLRGYLQGHKFITITSVSQVIEQVIRIAIVLVSSYVIINVFGFDVSYGVAVALLGAFFGGLFAFIYLNHKRVKNIKKVEVLEEKETDEKEVSSKEIIKKIITYSIPVILVSAISNLYNIMDTKLVILGLSQIGYDAAKSEVIASIISTWAPKVCVIIMAIATGMVSSIIPHIVNNYVNNEKEEVKNKIDQALKIIFTISIPTAIGIFVLSEPIYYIFYGYNDYGSIILKYVAIVNILCCLFTILNTILQSIKKFKSVYFNTFSGLLFIIILDIPFIHLFNSIGLSPYVATVFATILGYLISCSLAFVSLKKYLDYDVKRIFSFLFKIIIPCVLMIVTLLIMKFILPINLSYGYLKTLILLVLYAFVACIVFFASAHKLGIVTDVLGYNVVEKIKNKFRKK